MNNYSWFTLFVIASFVIILMGGFTYSSSLESNSRITSTRGSADLSIEPNIIFDFSHDVTWSDYDNNYYHATAKVNYDDVLSSRLHKRKLSLNNWGEFYKNLFHFDKDKLESIYQMFNKIQTKHQLLKQDFANSLVSFVQSIPYNYVTMLDCNTIYLTNKEVKEDMDNGVECDGEIFGGIYTPTEFIMNFKGDCDSRSVFLYTVLKRYGYDVVILNSELYKHSIIGLNIPSSGVYKAYLGKRYYVWETTYPGFRIGMISPEVSNMNYWNVEL